MSVSLASSFLSRELSSAVRHTGPVLLLASGPASKHLSNLHRRGLGQGPLGTAQPITSWRPIHPSRLFSSSHQPWRKATDPTQRSYASGGLLLLRLSSSPLFPSRVSSACSTAAEPAVSTHASPKATYGQLAHRAWRQSAEVGPLQRPSGPKRRERSTKADSHDNEKLSSPQPNVDATKHSVEANGNAHPAELESLADSVSKYLHLPKIPHRPTKDELLAAATGFWQRMGVRLKWVSIRSTRPWNVDEWSAFVSALIFGHLLWILVGTTTFFSLIILMINTVFAQETLAKWIGDYLTKSAGLTVIFESAIVPKWGDGVISFRNVFVSHRPGQSHSTVFKGSSNAAAEAAAARQADHDAAHAEEEDDGNYTQFDFTINTVNVTLSFAKWWNGKGILKDVEVKGVRGVIDRTSVEWSAAGKDPLAYRHEHRPGDFELEHFKLEDLLVTVHQPRGFRPFTVSIFSCELPQLRRQWVFYDFLSAGHMSGSYDGSLFTIHPRQIHNVAAADDNGTDELGKPGVWKKFSRVRIDGLKIDHLNRGVQGPFGWIYEGNVDIVADISFPNDAEEGFGKVMAEFYDKMEEAVTSNRYVRMLESNEPLLSEDIAVAAEAAQSSSPASFDQATPTGPLEDYARGYLVMDLRIHLNDVRAAVPLFSKPHIGYVNQALVRPIVAYINAKRTYIPISCRIVKRHTDFDGALTLWECGLLDDLGAEVYTAFARDVQDQQHRVRRFKRVGLWTLSLVAQALLAGVVGDLM